VVAAATRPLSTFELASPIFVISAEGVRGGVRRRSESVVVWDFSSVVQAFVTSSGFGRVADGVVEDDGAAVVEGESESEER
jgi:hypothetical protein